MDGSSKKLITRIVSIAHLEIVLDLGDEVCYTKNTAEEDLRDEIYNAMELVRWEVGACGKLFFH